MKNKKFLGLIVASLLITLVVCIAATSLIASMQTPVKANTVSITTVSENILATGSVHSLQEATLHFTTGGKLVYLPFKEGDSVTSGQTIAQLDPYPFQEQLTAALNTYRSTRDTFDQTQDNAQNGVLFGQQRYNIEVPNKSGITTGDVENNIINDMIKRIVDQNQANLDNSVISVQLANYALQLASLTSPFDGTLIQEDVTTPQVTVTPQTSFVVADLSQKVFRAQVDTSDIDFISVGAQARITLDGQKNAVQGTVVHIYPQKQTLPSGQEVYAVDIQSDGLSTAPYLSNGSVLIENNSESQVSMIPVWTLLGHTSVWVWEKNHAVLKHITTGKTHGDMVEVLSGLTPDDTIITNPSVLTRKEYAL